MGDPDQRMTGRKAALISICAIFGPLSILAVWLRFYARKLRRAGYGADDWTIAVTLVGVQYRYRIGLC